jgi:hypothetical protein
MRNWSPPIEFTFQQESSGVLELDLTIRKLTYVTPQCSLASRETDRRSTSVSKFALPVSCFVVNPRHCSRKCACCSWQRACLKKYVSNRYMLT